jgi:hypothetical protein
MLNTFVLRTENQNDRMSSTGHRHQHMISMRSITLLYRNCNNLKTSSWYYCRHWHACRCVCVCCARSRGITVIPTVGEEQRKPTRG